MLRIQPFEPIRTDAAHTQGVLPIGNIGPARGIILEGTVENDVRRAVKQLGTIAMHCRHRLPCET